MPTATYLERRGQIETYFDRTAAEAWRRLTSTEPVGRIRATVRAGRDQMRQTLLDWLPADLEASRLLDAGCGTGALSIAAAGRGGDVVAIDLSPTLVQLANERSPRIAGTGAVTFLVGDMLNPDLGRFDHVVAMDSLIHYGARDVIRVLSNIATRTERSILFTFAPRTPLLATMHAVGRLFPRGDRAPAIEPIAEATMDRLLAAEPGLRDWRRARTHRVMTGFYMSQAMELVRR
jgi:magnesium-protoporphyrin O-methyltransferase